MRRCKLGVKTTLVACLIIGSLTLFAQQTTALRQLLPTASRTNAQIVSSSITNPPRKSQLWAANKPRIWQPSLNKKNTGSAGATVSPGIWNPKSAGKSESTAAAAAKWMTPPSVDLSPKEITKEIMSFFKESMGNPVQDELFKQRLSSAQVQQHLDGLHVLTVLFQTARSRRLVKNIMPSQLMLERLSAWDNVWNERDISAFVYGIRALECIDAVDGELLKLAAAKIRASPALLSSRSIGNALYGLQDITSDTAGASLLCGALAEKIEQFEGDLNGQDIGIGLYGMQGLSADSAEVKRLIRAMADKIRDSVAEFDEQALPNALYGLQSMSSDEPVVLDLVSALSAKVSESQPQLSAQAIGSALYGLQRMSSDALQVRTLLAALAEKLETSTASLDAQAIGNALFGLQRMKSNSAEVRTLVQAIATKMVALEVQMDSRSIGSALYGLHSMSSDVPQVRSLLSALAERIAASKCSLSGQGIADALYGLFGMTYDCVELRQLLAALADRIDDSRGKLDSQEIGNALYGLQGISSDMKEVRVIVSKLAEKIRRSSAVLRSQHIGRAMFGLQRFTADNPEVRSLLRQLTKRMEESDRTRMTGQSIADALYGLQGFSSDVAEVQELIGALAKKIAVTGAEMTSQQLGRALFGLQGLRTTASIFEDSVVGVDSDELQFLLSALWDKVKVRKEGMDLADIGRGMQGVTLLRDPIGNNLRQYMYLQVLRLGIERIEQIEAQISSAPSPDTTTVAAAVATDVDQRAVVDIDEEDRGLDLGFDEFASDTEFSSTGATATTASSSSARAGTASNAASVGGRKKLVQMVELEPLDPEDVIMAVRSLRLNNLMVPKWLAKEYLSVESLHQKKALLPMSRSDRLVTQQFSFQYPQERVEVNALMDGFRLDMYFPELRLDVELDGPTHRFPARARFDNERDAYVRSKGLQVERVLLEGKSVEEVVKEIQLLVAQQKDRIAEAEIQALYSAENDVSRLYAKKKQQ